MFFVGSLRRRWNLILAARDEIFRQSAPLDREAIAAIPDGTYTAEGCLDNDGIGQEPVVVKVRIDVDGDQMSIDLADSLNGYGRSRECGIAQTISAARVAYKLLINADRPVDGGTFPTLTVKAPEGSIFYAQEPTACQWYFIPLCLLIDLIVKALSPALPQKVAGAHYGDSMVIYLAGLDPHKGNILICQLRQIREGGALSRMAMGRMAGIVVAA